ncbi:MAG: electron transport complex subunit E [Eubacterium sp.]|nr:electron transport complex subunit E [Eubacterium sp.]
MRHLKKDSPIERIWNGIYTENPVFCLILGMCPTLATTTSAINGIGMGLSTTIILALAELLISLLRKVIPSRMRMPAYIVVIASFVTMVDFLMAGFTPDLYKSLGIYIPLIVVNCIIMGRAEAYAGKMKPIPALFDGLGMGIGFTLALFLLGSIREIIGAGTWFGVKIMPASYVPINIFVLAPGAFLVLAWLVAIMNKLKIGAGRRPGVDPTTKKDVCGNCMNCMKLGMCEGKEAMQAAMEEAKAKAAAAEAAKPAPAVGPVPASKPDEPVKAAAPAEEVKKEEV